MSTEEEILEKLLKDNVEFRKMKELHSEYKQRLEEFGKKHYLSDSEIIEKKKLKKKKLAAKDKMAAIIEEARA